MLPSPVYTFIWQVALQSTRSRPKRVTLRLAFAIVSEEEFRAKAMRLNSPVIFPFEEFPDDVVVVLGRMASVLSVKKRTRKRHGQYWKCPEVLSTPRIWSLTY